MKDPNDFITKILALADKNGWIVIEWNIQSPSWLILEDGGGTKVQIASPHGIDLPYYVEQFKARPR
jgi:hypothetical protein